MKISTIHKNIILMPFNILYKLSPKLTLEILFKLKQGYRLNLDNPKTYNEKLQWIKLYDKNKFMPKCCDKYTVREYVKSSGCDEILNELYWEGFNPEDIPFDELPDKFVIKVTHGSTFNIICKNKSELDRRKTIIKLKKWLKSKFLLCYGEWFYGKERPRIIVEKYLEDDNSKELFDYKVFCFNGVPKIIDVHSSRFGEHKRNIYDINWNHLDNIKFTKFEQGNIISKPKVLDDLLEYARKLSSDFLHARVDFYIVNGKIYFGEITFTNGAGFSKISPHEFDIEMGSWLNLNYKEV